MRIVCCSLALRGHFTPLIPFIETSLDQGHDVTIVGPEGLGASALATRARFATCDSPDQAAIDELMERRARASLDEQARIMNGEYFAGLWTDAMLPAVRDACDESTDLILREPCAYAGAVVAARTGVASAQVAISNAASEWWCSELAESYLAQHEARVGDTLRRAPFVSRFPASLDPSQFVHTVRYHESVPADTARAESSRPLVYVTIGTVTPTYVGGAEFLGSLVDALSGLDVDVVASTGHSMRRDEFTKPFTNVRVEQWVDQAEMLTRASLVVCHGGSGTTYAALAAGVPVVAVPRFADQFSNARTIERARAGRNIELDTTDVGALTSREVELVREAAADVLRDPQYRSNAKAIADELRRSDDVATCLERLTRYAQRGYDAL